MFERELASVKYEYDKALNTVKGLGDNLTSMFKEKTIKIKDNCSKFFSRIELQTERNTKDVL